MTDPDHALDAIARAATDLLPELTERLARHGLGELEVTDGDLRLRVRGNASPLTERRAAASEADHRPAPGTRALRGDAEDGTDGSIPVGSPAVGFFVYADGLGPGLEVERGDALGHVEMLGIRHDVRAPRAGRVRNLVAESGEAVEYGQVIVELEPVETSR